MRFHRRCGDRVTLLNDNCTAVRNFVEFNHGLILSAEPLQDDVLFEVRVDRKVNAWNGSLEIGVTSLDPDYIELPATATKLRNSAWILSGTSVIRDGMTVNVSYSPELNSLQEGDCIGVMRTRKGQLMFYINGRSLGVAAKDMPPRLFAVIDLYGQCVQVTIVPSIGMQPIMESSLDQEDPNNDEAFSPSDLDLPSPPNFTVDSDEDDNLPTTSQNLVCALMPHDTLRFHPRCGILVKLSANNRTAERARPLDDYNNGVVMTHRPLHDNELFEIRIEQLVDKWSGSIEVGVTTHNPASMRFPSTMTNMDTGTIMLSGCKVLVNGRGTCKEYTNFNLDELREGETVGLMRRSSGKLHYFINGVDQGEAKDKVAPQVWGVVDLYGMTVKVTIVDPISMVSIYTDNNFHNVPTPEDVSEVQALCRYSPRIDEDSLLFHTLRDSNVIVINDGKTAHRPNAFEVFNNGIVMTNRTLKTNELFQVRLDLIIPKWAGSIEIGVTQRSCNEIELPFKMSNAKSGTWAMAGEDVIREDTIIIPQYVRNLNRLVEGDTIGVMRKDMGILHFFVNGIDQGPAAFNIPEHVFGILDLYGRVAQASIVDSYLPPPYSPESPLSTESNATVYPEMCFHHVHGCNARLSRNRLTASRATFYSEFNDAVLFSSRPLRECEMFEVRIDKMVDGWIGSLEMGVTAMRPEEMETYGGCAVAGTATALRGDTYILSGGAMMKDGECMRSCYRLNLDCLNVGSRVGMMWHADRSLHYYLDGMDQGKAWHVPHLNVYAVVDLYGRCTQVSIIQNEERAFNYNGCTNSENYLLSIPRISPPQPYCFSEYCGNNVVLRMGYSIAARLNSDPNATLVFSAAHLAVDEIFEIKLLTCDSKFAGSFRLGVTDINILNAHINRSLPPAISYLPHYTAYIDGNYIHYTRLGFPGERELCSIEPSFDWLRQNDRIGLKKTGDGRVLIYYNSEQLDAIFEKVPDKVYVVMQLYGRVTSIQAISKLINAGTSVPQPTALPNENALSTKDEEIGNGIITINSPVTEVTSKKIADVEPEVCKQNNSLPFTFHHVHGKNITLYSSDTVAIRKTGYSGGIVIASRPLQRGQSFFFRVDKMSNNWSGSIAVGALTQIPTELPSSALSLDAPCWIITSDLVNDNGSINKSTNGCRLERVKQGSILALHFTDDGDLLLEVDRAISLIADISKYTLLYPVVDLYGCVLQVSTLLYFNVATNLSPFTFEADVYDQSKAAIEIDECEPDPQPGPSTLIVEDENLDHLTRWSSLQNIEAVPRHLRKLKDNFTDSSETLKWDQYDNRETSASMHCDTNIKNNDRFPEACRGMRRLSHKTEDIVNRNENDSLALNCEAFSNDAHLQSEESIEDVEPSKMKDSFDTSNEANVEPSNDENVEAAVKSSERASSSGGNVENAEAVTLVESETESYTLQNTIYFHNLITNAANVRNHYQNENDTSTCCSHIQNVYRFCKYILGWEDLKQFWRKSDCYCIECRPRSTREEAGWAYLLVMEPLWRQNVGSHAYWHISIGTLTKIQQLREKGERPAELPNTPFQANAQTETWCYNEETYQGKLVLDVDISPESLEFDKLSGMWVYLRRTHSTAMEKVSNETKPSR